MFIFSSFLSVLDESFSSNGTSFYTALEEPATNSELEFLSLLSDSDTDASQTLEVG